MTKVQVNRLVVSLLSLFLGATSTVSAAEYSDKPSAIQVTDKEGKTSKLTEFGIVYRAFADNTLENSIRDRVIVERADKPWTTVQEIPWSKIDRIDVSDKNDYRITLTDGMVVSKEQLRGGNIVGYTVDGKKVVKHLTIQIRSIQVLRPKASTPDEDKVLETKAQKDDTRLTFTVDQEIGLSSSKTMLTLDSKGVTYRNENMKADRLIPWAAIIQWEGKYIGKGRPGSPKADTEFFSFRINVDKYLIPREKRHPTVAPTGWLSFRFDWRADAEAAFDFTQKHHPKGEVNIR